MTPNQQYQMYCDKRYLYRGFHPDKDGNTVITLDGEAIRGEWLYGPAIIFKNHSSIYDRENSISRYVFSETVGQWAAVDKNGKDIFEGDILHIDVDNEHPDITLRGQRHITNGTVVFENGEFSLCGERLVLCTYYGVKILSAYSCFKDYELIGNKWEVAGK